MPQAERTTERRDIDWQGMIDTALTAPGSLSSSYNRFHEYSFNNQILLYMQGVREPVATYNRWKSIGRQVLRGSRAKEILRPIIIEKKDEAGDVTDKIMRFKFVKCLFTYSETDGEEIALPEVPEWSLERAEKELDIKRVPYTMLSANASGYSTGRNYAVSPVDEHPLMTTLHEWGHILCGHTTPEKSVEYQAHRGLFEFQAEAVSFLAGHELEVITEQEASESRGYVQNWLRGQRPADQAIRQVFTVTDKILRAGRCPDRAVADIDVA